MIATQVGNGDWYLSRTNGSRRSWWFVKRYFNRGIIVLSLGRDKPCSLTLPPEFIGKKIRFKIEIIKEVE